MTRDAAGRFVRGSPPPPAETVPPAASVSPEPETVASRSSAPPAMPRLRLLVEDVTPAIAPPPPPPGAGPEEPGPEVDDVPLYAGLARGIDWIIGAAMGDTYRAPEHRVDAVGEAIAPVGRRVAGLVGASGVVDASVPPLVRELGTLAAALYVAWGDAFVDAFRAALEARRAEREATDGDTPDRPPRGDDGRARGGDRAARPRAPRADGPGGAGEVPPADPPVRPPGPSEGRGADLAAAFAGGRALGSGAG